MADCDFKKFFFILSDCQYFLDFSSDLLCTLPFSCICFHVLVSVVSVSPFKPCSVSAFSEFLFFRYSLSAPTSSSYLHLNVFRDVWCSIVPGFALFCCIFHALCTCLLNGGKKLCSLLNVCLSLIAMCWC